MCHSSLRGKRGLFHAAPRGEGLAAHPAAVEGIQHPGLLVFARSFVFAICSKPTVRTIQRTRWGRLSAYLEVARETVRMAAQTPLPEHHEFVRFNLHEINSSFSVCIIAIPSSDSKKYSL